MYSADESRPMGESGSTSSPGSSEPTNSTVTSNPPTGCEPLCDACLALLKECGEDLWPLYSKKLFGRTWPGTKSPVEVAYCRAHRSERQQEVAERRAEAMRSAHEARRKADSKAGFPRYTEGVLPKAEVQDNLPAATERERSMDDVTGGSLGAARAVPDDCQSRDRLPRPKARTNLGGRIVLGKRRGGIRRRRESAVL